MAYTTINKSTDYFNTKLYTGNSSTLNVTGVGHQPDFVWIKDRSSSGDDYAMYDAVRGVNKRIRSNQNDAENTETAALTSFDSDGFTVGTAGSSNGNGDSFVAWNWKANGQGSSNTDGSINTTYTSVNTTAGFSISQYTGTGATATIGHGLGVVPKMIIIKQTNTTRNWVVGHDGIGWTKYLYLDSTNAQGTGNLFNDTAPTNSVFSVVNDGGVNGSGGTYIAYCFAEKTGYSKFGSYVGTGNTNGTFVYTGFKPAFVIVKIAEHAGNWMMYDNKRNPHNLMNEYLYVNAYQAAASNSEGFDFLSNGFKMRNTFGDANTVNNKYIYMAFAEEPLVANVGASIPATAR